MTKTFLGHFYATQKPFFLPSLERPTPFPISTSLCYISLFSGCRNIAYGGDPLYVGGQIVSAIAEADFDIPLPFFLQNVFFMYNT